MNCYKFYYKEDQLVCWKLSDVRFFGTDYEVAALAFYKYMEKKNTIIYNVAAYPDKIDLINESGDDIDVSKIMMKIQKLE